MRRTVYIGDDYNTFEQGDVFYRGKNFGFLLPEIAQHFNIVYGCKYRITIVEGTEYFFTKGVSEYSYIIRLKKDPKKYLSFVCQEAFDKLFFVPDPEKRYDIIVKKIG